MRLNLLSRQRRNADPAISDEVLQGRFGAHFPQLFAYVRAFVDDDAGARDIVVEAFSRAFVRCPDVPDGEFRLVLFSLARGLCRPVGIGRVDGALSSRERDVLALLFDAQLNRGEIGRLLKVKERAVTAALVGGLRKLRATPPAALAAQFNLT